MKKENFELQFFHHEALEYPIESGQPDINEETPLVRTRKFSNTVEIELTESYKSYCSITFSNRYKRPFFAITLNALSNTTREGNCNILTKEAFNLEYNLQVYKQTFHIRARNN